MSTSNGLLNSLPDVGTGLRGPKTFYDLYSITKNDDRTGYIFTSLQKWANASGIRGSNGEKAQQVVIRNFMKDDRKQDQPSWARQWISLAYYSGENAGSDQLDANTVPSKDQYTVLLRYFSQLSLKFEDKDEVALRMINNARKAMGLGWTLEYGDARWELENGTSGPMEMVENDTSAIMRVGAMEKDGISESNGANLSIGTDLRDPGSSRQTPPNEHDCQDDPDSHTQVDDSLISSTKGDTSINKTQGRISTSFESCLPSAQAGAGGGPLSPVTPSLSEPMSSACSIEPLTPNIPQGPRVFYDIAAIVNSDSDADTDYILQHLLRWKNAESTSLTRASRRSSGVDQGVEDAKRKIWILRNFIAEDKAKPQPSWATQWIQLISRPFNPSIPLSAHFLDVHSHPALNDDDKPIFYRLFLEFFSLLLHGEKSSIDDAILLLGRRRKEMGFDWTLTYGKKVALEYAKVDKRAVASLDYQEMLGEDAGMTEMDYSIQFTDWANVMASSGLSGGRAAAEFMNLSRPVEQQEELAININRAPPIWDPPQPLPEPQEDLTFSSGPISFKSEFSAMLERIGRPEPGLSGKQHLWSRTRAELCETTPYFRSYQGGVHLDRSSKLMGYLLDGCPAPGDLWHNTGRFIISHAGGGSSSHKPNTSLEAAQNSNKGNTHSSVPLRRVLLSSVVYPRNDADNVDPFISTDTKDRKETMAISPKRHLDRDQTSDDLNVGRLLAARTKGEPIVLIVGSNYRWWPLMMKGIGADSTLLGNQDNCRGRYAVLGWYLVRDAWQELEPGIVENIQSTDGHWVSHTTLRTRWRFSFQWIEDQGIPWWVEDLRAADAQFSPSRFNSREQRGSLNDPMDDEESKSSQTQNSNGLTGHRCLEDSDLKTIPDASVVETGRLSPISVNLNQACASCFKTSLRIYHNGWFCTNSSCTQFSMLLDGRLSTSITLTYSESFVNRAPLPTAHRTDTRKESSTGFLDKSENVWSVIPTYRDDLASYERDHWHGRCCLSCGRLNSKIEWNVWTCRSCQRILESVPPHIYELDECTTEHPRFPIPDWADHEGMNSQHTCETRNDGSVVHSFIFPNGGAVYLVRRPSNTAADQMLRDYQNEAATRSMFRRLLLKRAPVLGTYTSHFCHNAGVPYEFSCNVETETFEEAPPVVTAAKDYLADEASSVLHRPITFNEVLSCAYKKDQSMNFHSDDELGVQNTIAAISLGAPAKMSFRPRKPGAGNAKVCFELILRHGDVLIMDGRGIQENYQHRVIPYGLRFAATARLIDTRLAGSGRRYKPPRMPKSHVESIPNQAMVDTRIIPPRDYVITIPPDNQMLWNHLAWKNANLPNPISSHLPATSRIERPGSIMESPDSADIPLAQVAWQLSHLDPRGNEISETSSTLTSILEDQLIMDQQNGSSEIGEAGFEPIIRINSNALSSSDLVRFPPFKTGAISCPPCEIAPVSYPYASSTPILPEQSNMQVEEWNKGSAGPRRSGNTQCIHHLPTTLDRSMKLPAINLGHPSALELCLPNPTLPALSSLVNDDYNSHGPLGTGTFKKRAIEEMQRSFHPSIRPRVGRPFSPLAACLSFKPSNEEEDAVLASGLGNDNLSENDGLEPMQLEDDNTTSTRPFFGAWECDTPPGLDIPFPTEIDEDSVMTDAFTEPSGTGPMLADITIPPAAELVEGDGY